MRDTLKVLALPAVFAGALFAFSLSPGRIGLYGFVAVLGLVMLPRLRKSPEVLLALTIVYMPLARLYAARLAPGLNGTNILELVLVGMWVWGAARRKEPMFGRYAFTRLVAVWVFLTFVSVITAISDIGVNSFLWDYLETLRGFLDQFIVFYLFVNLIRDENMARRLFIYMMVSASLVFLYGFHEWFGTRFIDSIDKSRLLGPVGQPNDYAAQIVYCISPLLAYAAYYFPRLRILRVIPLLGIGVRVLLGAFSRGGYLAFAMEIFAMAAARGLRYIVLMMAALTAVYLTVPQLIPGSMRARIDQTFHDRAAGSEIDKSAASRFILWDAAIAMTEQHPLLGVGFDQYPRLSRQYETEYVEATDNQNMFLYAASNMGIPGLLAFVSLLIALLWRAWRISRDASRPDIDRIIGLGAVGLVAGLVGVNMFGTHVIDTAVDSFIWLYMAIIARLPSMQGKGLKAGAPKAVGPASARLGGKGARRV